MLSSSTTIPIGSMLDFHVITYISNEMKLVLNQGSHKAYVTQSTWK